MKKTKAVSLLLSLLLIYVAIPCTLALPAKAEGEHPDNGMVISKTATANGDGTYKISLEAYATGDKVITEIKEDIPTDIVLVLDQSGSMNDNMTTKETFEAYINQDNEALYKKRFNNSWFLVDKNLYYPLDGGYVQVQVDREKIGSFLNTVYKYTYYYQLAGQARVVIETSTGSDITPNETYYQFVTENISRLDALKSAVQTFKNSIATKAAGADGILGTDDDVNHRVAVVGFASGNKYYNQHAYENTEVFIGSSQYQYGNSAQGVYGRAFQDMNTQSGQNNVLASVNALTANGATKADLGMEMANGILNANPVPKGEKRARVVVFFTDGSPTAQSSFQQNVADAAIANAKTIKDNGTTVYSVGVFAGADATANGIASNNSSRRENQFMQSVSSNNGTPQDPSYYLSASDAETLNSIFQQISNNIESGGSTTTLDEQTVIKDIIAPQFALPTGATVDDIKLETYKCTGKTGDNYTWEKNLDAMGAQAVVNGDTVDVTGFDFAANYVGTVTDNGNVTYRGNKLVISFNVKPKDGFLGGNNIETNTNAGVYVNSDAAEPIMTFEKPKVNVPIPDVTVTPEEKNVYLLDDLTANDLRNGTTATVGSVNLDLTKADQNYGLEDWQTSGVDITVKITDADGNEVTGDLKDLTDDTTYTVTVTVSPKEEAATTSSGDAAAEKSGDNTAAINVFKPVLTYKDSEVYYGDAVPADFTTNLTETVWKHGDDTATNEMGEAPKLQLTYTPDANKISGGKINTKQDVEVNAAVKIGNTDVTQYTTFNHTACSGTCSWNEPSVGGSPAFLLHVKTCQLTISKAGGASDEPYVFTVYKDGTKYTEVTIVGNNSETIFELPIGTYTIKEDKGWSWRYAAADNGKAVLSAENTEDTITCTNTAQKDKWLNGFSDVVKNVFGVSNVAANVFSGQ